MLTISNVSASEITNETNDLISNVNDNQVIESFDDIDYLSANNEGTFTDLANEIANANASGELKLTKNYVYDSSKDSIYKNGIEIDKEITINGKGFFINGQNQARAFYISSSNVILRNIEFDECYSSGDGGAVYWNGADGSLFDCNFIDCNSSSSGGAVYWNGADGSLFDCSFINCLCSRSISSNGGSSSSSYGYGGAVYWNGTNGTLFDCSFENCKNLVSNYNTVYSTSHTPGFMPTSSSRSNSYSYGGAVYWNGVDGSVYNCDFINCYSYSYSKSDSWSYFQDPQHTIFTYSASSTSTCYSYSYGVYWNGDNGNLSECSFINSSSSYSYDSLSDSQTDSYSSAVKASTNAKSYSYGGAVYWNGNNGNLFECSFITPVSYHSDINFGYGGAVYWHGNDGIIINSSFINCHVPNKGNANDIYWYGINGYLLNSIFINSNSGSNNKDSIYWYGTNGNLFNCNFNGNYYNYEEYCSKVSDITVHPIILIHTSAFNDNNRIVIFESTPLVNNISVKIYNVTDRKTLYDEFNISSKDLTSSYTVNNLGEGEYQIVLGYAGDAFYSSTSVNNLFKIGENSSYEVKITENLFEGDNATINLTLNEDATGKVKITSSDYTCINELVDGKTTFTIPNVSGGVNYYQIKYEGDDKYNPIYINDTFNALFKSSICLDLREDKIYNENMPLKYYLTSGCTGIISVFIDNDFIANVSVGEVYEFENIDVGEHNITVFYNGDEYFSTSTDSATLTVLKADPNFNINLTDIDYKQDFEAEISFSSDVTGTLNISLTDENGRVVDKKLNVSLLNNVVNYEFSNLNASKYYLTLNYSGNDNYNAYDETASFNVFKIDPTIDYYITNSTYGKPAKIVVNTDATGNVTFKVGSITYEEVLIKNSYILQSIEDIDAGNYSVKIIYNGDSNYNAKTYDAQLTISRIATTVEGSVEDIAYSQNIKVNVEGSADGIAIVKIDENLIDYVEIMVNTTSQVIFEDITTGKHTLSIVLKPFNNNFEDSSYSTDFDYKLNTNIAVEDILVEYDGDAVLSAILINEATGQAIKNANVIFEINGGKYSAKTDASGQAKVTVSGLAPGTYEATVTYKGNSKYVASSETFNVVVSKIITSISLYYDAESNELVATLINAETGKGIKGGNVVFNLEGTKTAIKTDKFGQARLTVSGVDLDKFHAAISYGGNSKYLKSTASIDIVAGKIPTKVSNVYNKETQEAIATLTNNQTGQAIKGATVVFNINGVKTAFKTDKLGQVRISVAGLDLGQNSISSSYGGNSKYSKTTANINIVKI